MDRMLYIAMSGAAETLRAQAAQTHNLANASTPGFRADLEQFRSMPLYGPGLPTRVFALQERPGVDLRPGSIHTTGRDLDVAVDGSGYLAVQAPDGSEAYTRAGDLRIDGNGVLTTGAGRPVLGNGGPIAIPPAAKIEIGADGTITVLPAGQNSLNLAVVDRIKLVNPAAGSLGKGADGLLRVRGGAPAPADAAVKLRGGALEQSNANPIEAMVRMIELARRFELQVQMMHTARQDDASAAQLLRVV